MDNYPKILIIAGSDSGGGAGIQADIKTVTCLGGYAMTAITALTAQNTLGVDGILDIDEEFIAKQIKITLSDIGADAIKTGMLNKQNVIETVADTLLEYPHIPLILDPVMFAKGGSCLLPPSALTALKEKLIPKALIITPNIPEAEYLSGITINNIDDMKKAARKILTFGCKAVLLKSGHLKSDRITDLLLTEDGENIIEHERIASKNTHGTGCTLASAIAYGIGSSMSLENSVKQAENYVLQAIKSAYDIGHGHGPLNHNYMINHIL
ncbi:MAG: bifunctional hydroxymethylpyrimidine kinase/phosphomethylpyrimidine kinase [Rickettsiales bacterium]